jgi:hypothetical protein
MHPGNKKDVGYRVDFIPEKGVRMTTVSGVKQQSTTHRIILLDYPTTSDHYHSPFSENGHSGMWSEHYPSRLRDGGERRQMPKSDE